MLAQPVFDSNLNPTTIINPPTSLIGGNNVPMPMVIDSINTTTQQNANVLTTTPTPTTVAPTPIIPKSKRLKGVTISRPILFGNIAWPIKDATGKTHRWMCYVRGLNNEDISYWIKKVVFTLHPSFAQPKISMNYFFYFILFFYVIFFIHSFMFV